MSREGSWGGLAGDGNAIGNGDKYGYGHGDEKGTGTFGASHLGGGGLNVPSINLGPGVPGGGAQTPIPGDTSSLDSTSTVQPQPQPQPRLPPQAQGQGQGQLPPAALAQLAALNGTSTPASLALSALGPAPGGQTAVGFFTPMTKVYIGDVIDHLEIIVSSLDQFVATCDHLTDYVFVSGVRFGSVCARTRVVRGGHAMRRATSRAMRPEARGADVKEARGVAGEGGERNDERMEED
jgi:hypothetical protein